MAPKLADITIEKADVVEYLDSYSDFAFEIETLNKMISIGFDCQHSGVYQDPIEGKSREFDIRATKILHRDGNKVIKICLAAECKNIRANYPLVFHCLPRKPNESYINIVWGGGAARNVNAPYRRLGNRIEIKGPNCPYVHGEYVAKSTDQIGRRHSDKVLINNDSDLFTKVSQAINSSYDLFFSAHKEGSVTDSVISIILPILVVPPNKMWACNYTAEGMRDGEPVLVPNIQ